MASLILSRWPLMTIATYGLGHTVFKLDGHRLFKTPLLPIIWHNSCGTAVDTTMVEASGCIQRHTVISKKTEYNDMVLTHDGFQNRIDGMFKSSLTAIQLLAHICAKIHTLQYSLVVWIHGLLPLSSSRPSTCVRNPQLVSFLPQ